MKTKVVNGWILKDECVSCHNPIPLELGNFTVRGNFCGPCCTAADRRIKTKMRQIVRDEYYKQKPEDIFNLLV